MTEKAFFAHESSFVDDPSSVGAGTKIWHFSHIMKGAVLGERCSIGQNVYIGAKAVLGTNVKVQNNVSIYDAVEIEDDVFCGPSMVFTNVINPRSHIVRKSEYKTTRIRKGATLGANSTIVCGVTVGRYSFIGAGAVVTKDVPDFALVVGVPAVTVGYVCQCGERLPLTSSDLTENLKQACKFCGDEYVFRNQSLFSLRLSGNA